MKPNRQMLLPFPGLEEDLLTKDGAEQSFEPRSLNGKSDLEKRIINEPIPFPTNPFMDVFKRFGRDEALAGVGNVSSTAVFDMIFRNVLSQGVLDGALAFVGPVLEKAWLMGYYIKDAADVWKTTPKADRKRICSYLGDIFNAGKATLIEDIVVHDPIYASMVYAGLKMYPHTPAWMVSTVSFLASVTLVAGLEIGVSELRFKNFKRKLRKAGLCQERYYESRFLISADKHPDALLDAVCNEFGLDETSVWNYHDVYFDNNIKEYSGRRPHLRLRDRNNAAGDVMRTAQVIYKREVDVGCRKQEWHTYLPTLKDKMYFMLDQERMPHSMDEIEDPAVRGILGGLAIPGSEGKNVNFTREYVRSDDLLVSTDRVLVDRPFYVVELKTYDKIDIMKEAMRYIMIEFPVIPTTHGKAHLMRMQ